MLKARPELLNDTVAKLWSRFFCLSVYITMYLNDHQRTAFYEALGMNTKQFNQVGGCLARATRAALMHAGDAVNGPWLFCP